MLIYCTISISLYGINIFDSVLKWVVYINTPQSPCVAWEEMKSCSKFLRDLVTTEHFTDGNCISKSETCGVNLVLKETRNPSKIRALGFEKKL